MEESRNPGGKGIGKKKENGFHSWSIEPSRLPAQSKGKKAEPLFKLFSEFSETFTKKSEKSNEKNCEGILKLKTGFVSGQSQDRIVGLLRSTYNRVTAQSSMFKLSQGMRIPVLASKTAFAFLLFIFLLIITSQNILALGLAHSSADITFTPNSRHVVDMAIHNNEGKDVTVFIYAEGELARFISIPEPLIKISSSQTEVKTSYIVNLPASLEKQGLHETNIIIREISGNAVGESQVAASLAIISKLRVFVPYTGRYAEIKLIAPHFEINKQSNFAVEVNNLGTEGIVKGYVTLNIYGLLNNTVKTLKSEEFSLDSKQKKVVVIPWTPDIGPGEYSAEATLVYNGPGANDKKTFTLGELSIEIISISVDKFRLGGIARFDIIVANNWNTPIENVYAETIVTDKDGKQYLSFKTVPLKVPAFGREKLEAYWDTSRVLPGPYKLDITLNYLGKTAKKMFNINVEQNRILISAAAVAPSGQGSVNNAVYMLIILVVILIIVVVILILYIKRITSSGSKKRGLVFLLLFLLLLLLAL